MFRRISVAKAMQQRPPSLSNSPAAPLTKEIVKSHLQGGHDAAKWFSWLIDDCLAGFGKKLDQPWDETQHERLFQLSGLYGQIVHEHPYTDILGLTYQELASNYGRKGLGQYFSPDEIARLMAQMTFDRALFEKQEVVRFSEPTAGSGVMVLAFMRTVIQDNPDWMRKLSVTMVDLDKVCVKMSVLQVLANNLIHQANLGEIRALHGNSLGNRQNLALFYHASTPDYDKAAARQVENNQKEAEGNESISSNSSKNSDISPLKSLEQI